TPLELVFHVRAAPRIGLARYPEAVATAPAGEPVAGHETAYPAGRCEDREVDDSHDDRRRDPGDGRREREPRPAHGLQARWRDQRSRDQSAPDRAEHPRLG